MNAIFNAQKIRLSKNLFSVKPSFQSRSELNALKEPKHEVLKMLTESTLQIKNFLFILYVLKLQT